MTITTGISTKHMDATKIMSIQKKTNKAGRDYYVIWAENGCCYGLSEKQFAKAEQCIVDIEPTTPLSVWYYMNGPWRNIVGISADFDQQSKAEDEQLPF